MFWRMDARFRIPASLLAAVCVVATTVTALLPAAAHGTAQPLRDVSATRLFGGAITTHARPLERALESGPPLARIACAGVTSAGTTCWVQRR